MIKSGLYSLCGMLLLTVLFASHAVAQSKTELDLIKTYLAKTSVDSEMTSSDVEELRILDIIDRKSLQAKTVYVQQVINGIPVHNAINSYTIKDNAVYATGNAFARQVDKAALKTQTSLEASQAIHFAGKEVRAQLDNGYRLITRTNDLISNFESQDVYGGKIKVSKEYKKNNESGLDLIYSVEFAPKNSADHWSILLDAQTGVIYKKENYTTYCSFPEHGHFLAPQNKKALKKQFNKQLSASSSMMGAQYNVVPLPYESLNFTDREIVTDPHDLTASPFGWHDLDGVEGADRTNLEGNNVFVQVDRNDDGGRDAGSADPDGGAELIFDFPYDDQAEPQVNTEAVMVNAFYLNNMLHDYAFRYGFDESINFQATNYGNEGQSGDEVIVGIQTGLDLTPPLTNNATFSTPADGSSGRMRVFVGTNGGGSTRITAPVNISGELNVGLAGYGGAINSTEVSGRIVQGIDASSLPTRGCDPLINEAEINGNVALVDRGECEFELKSWRAQEAGAIALIICNFENAPIGLGAGTDFQTSGFGPVTIPSVGLSSSDCDRIKMNLATGVDITFQTLDNSGPSLRDIGFDNGIMAHEYGHGLSNRSTGGPTVAGCLSNGEQMGEGWSDYFALVTSVIPGQDGTEARGTGTFGFGQTPEAGGIRRQPYSTDESVNNQTYNDILGETETHNIGEIWTDALWDMYWLFVEEHGFDADFIHGTGGNNMAMQLVFDGMFIQRCEPGFVSGRDAILISDRLRYNGDNQCMIWEAFAKRGIGFDADEIDTGITGDNIISFEVPPACVNKLLINKEMTKNVAAGDIITVDLTLSNFIPTTSTGIVVTDQIPAGTSVANGPADYDFEVVGNEISIAIGSMDSLAELALSYTLNTSAENKSVIFYEQNLEDFNDVYNNWDIDQLETGGDGFFELIEEDPNNAFTGENYWLTEAFGGDASDAVVFTTAEINLNVPNPVLRFYHRIINVEQGADGGFVQIKEAGDIVWQTISNDHIIRNKYNGRLAYSTITLPNIDAYYGSTSDYIDTYVDLNEWKNKNVNIRFRFATDENNNNGGSWYIDDMGLLNLVAYNSEACVTFAEGEGSCDMSADGGAVVEGIISKTVELEDGKFSFEIFPNPAVDHLNLNFQSAINRDVVLSVYTITGRKIHQETYDLNSGINQKKWNFKQLPTGIYIARVQVDGKEVSDKFVVE